VASWTAKAADIPEKIKRAPPFIIGILHDALTRMRCPAGDVLGIRAVLVHAIDEEARLFYERFEFEPCPGNALHLMLLMKDLRRLLGLRS